MVKDLGSGPVCVQDSIKPGSITYRFEKCADCSTSDTPNGCGFGEACCYDDECYNPSNADCCAGDKCNPGAVCDKVDGITTCCDKNNDGYVSSGECCSSSTPYCDNIWDVGFFGCEPIEERDCFPCLNDDHCVGSDMGCCMGFGCYSKLTQHCCGDECEANPCEGGTSTAAAGGVWETCYDPGEVGMTTECCEGDKPPRWRPSSMFSTVTCDTDVDGISETCCGEQYCDSDVWYDPLTEVCHDSSTVKKCWQCDPDSGGRNDARCEGSEPYCCYGSCMDLVDGDGNEATCCGNACWQEECNGCTTCLTETLKINWVDIDVDDGVTCMGGQITPGCTGQLKCTGCDECECEDGVCECVNKEDSLYDSQVDMGMNPACYIVCGFHQTEEWNDWIDDYEWCPTKFDMGSTHIVADGYCDGDDMTELVDEDEVTEEDVTDEDELVDEDEVTEEDVTDEDELVDEDEVTEEDVTDEDELVDEDEVTEEDVTDEDELVDEDEVTEEDVTDEDELVDEDEVTEEDELDEVVEDVLLDVLEAVEEVDELEDESTVVEDEVTDEEVVEVDVVSQQSGIIHAGAGPIQQSQPSSWLQ
ncbi:hypothetical protein ACFLRF_06390 [Candidatus Altiarchaeota archaeon]